MRRKPNRSRRIIKKLLKRAVPHPDWNIDAVIADGKRIVTAQEVMNAGIVRRQVTATGLRERKRATTNG